MGDDPGHLGLGGERQESTYKQAEGKLTCSARSELMAKHSLDFSAMERWLWPNEICRERYIYMTCLRDPIGRIKSSIKFHRLQTPQIIESWATTDFFNPAAPISNGSPSVDNFYVRSFAGKNVYMKPLGQVNANDLSIAKQLLQQFEVVLILEKLNDRDLVQLEKRLHWRKTSLPQTPKKSRAKKNDALSAQQESLLRERNALDMSFYAYADQVAAAISNECELG